MDFQNCPIIGKNVKITLLSQVRAAHMASSFFKPSACSTHGFCPVSGFQDVCHTFVIKKSAFSTLGFWVLPYFRISGCLSHLYQPLIGQILSTCLTQPISYCLIHFLERPSALHALGLHTMQDFFKASLKNSHGFNWLRAYFCDGIFFTLEIVLLS